jgi:hypothetical protein
MRSALKWSFLAAVALIAMLALYLLVPLLKEGWPTQSPLYAFGMAVILLVLMLAWRRVWVKARQSAKPGLYYYVGILFPTVPLLLYGWIGGMMTYYYLRAGIFEKRAIISRYHDSVIYWPGFAQPVGIRLELDVDVPFSMPGSFLAPKIVVADSNTSLPGHTAIENYFKYCTPPSDRSPCLTVPPSSYRPSPTSPSGGTLHLVYELFPSNVEHLEDSSRLCLKESAPEISRNRGGSHAIWLFGSEAGIVIDLSDALTERLHRDSTVDWTPATLNAMNVGFREDTLIRAGYRPCQLHGRTSGCYCRY